LLQGLFLDLVWFSLLQWSLVKYFGLVSCFWWPSLSKKHRRLDVHLKMETTTICKPYFQTFSKPYRGNNIWVLIYFPSFIAWGTSVYMVVSSKIPNLPLQIPFRCDVYILVVSSYFGHNQVFLQYLENLLFVPYVVFHCLNLCSPFQGRCDGWRMISINFHKWGNFLWSMKGFLYHHSAKGNYLTHCDCLLDAKQRIYLLNIYSQSQFSYRIEDGKMRYEPIDYPNKKIFQSKNFQWKLDLCHLQ